jgi:prevent-host-death family protein
MWLDIRDARTHFPKLVAAVEAGERVMICRNGKPIIECIPARSAAEFPFGSWGELCRPSLAHLVDPTGEEDLDAMGL